MSRLKIGGSIELKMLKGDLKAPEIAQVENMLNQNRQITDARIE